MNQNLKVWLEIQQVVAEIIWLHYAFLKGYLRRKFPLNFVTLVALKKLWASKSFCQPQKYCVDKAEAIETADGRGAEDQILIWC